MHYSKGAATWKACHSLFAVSFGKKCGLSMCPYLIPTEAGSRPTTSACSLFRYQTGPGRVHGQGDPVGGTRFHKGVLDPTAYRRYNTKIRRYIPKIHFLARLEAINDIAEALRSETADRTSSLTGNSVTRSAAEW